MILLDTNVLMALVDDREALHSAAAGDLRRVKDQALHVLDAVLSEAYFLLPHPTGRRRLRFLLEHLSIRSIAMNDAWWPDLFGWLEQYADQDPDFADAQLVVFTSRERSRVWTYDREFKKVWRRLDGSRVPLYGAQRAP